MKRRTLQMSESLIVGLFLSCVGGFLESYSFLSRDGVFANCQTGNLVLLAMHFAKHDWTKVLAYFIPILSFVIGVILTELIRTFANSHAIHWRQYILLLEAVLLFITGLLPSGRYNSIATTLIAFSCSMQVEAFRKVKGSVYATTMCTGNLRSGTYQLFCHFFKKEPASLGQAGNYFAVIAVFMAGAIFGSLATDIWHEKAIWLACLLLLLAGLLLFIRPKEPAAFNE